MAFTEQATQVNGVLNTIDSGQLRSQLTVTVTLSKILPIGLLGMLVAGFFVAFISTHDTYLHSWGAIFIQDVVLPVRQHIFKKSGHLAPKKHIFLLRASNSRRRDFHIYI